MRLIGYMAFIECSNCGHRTLLPTQRTDCRICGFPFATGAGSSPSSSGSPSGPSTFSSSSSSIPMPSSTILPPIPTKGPASPMPTSSSSSPGPSGSAASSPVRATALPGMPSRPADLEGDVVGEPKKDPVDRPLDWSDIVLRVLFFPLVFPFLVREFFKMHNSPKPTMMVYNLQIQRSSGGGLGEARLEGDVMGGMPRPGHQVSLWGRDRGGSLIVRQGYNHTVKAKISIRPPTMLWLTRSAALVLPVLAILAIVLFLPYIPAIISAVWTLLVLAIVFYFVIVLLVPWMPKRIVPFIVGFFILMAALSLCAHSGTYTP